MFLSSCSTRPSNDDACRHVSSPPRAHRNLDDSDRPLENLEPDRHMLQPVHPHCIGTTLLFHRLLMLCLCNQCWRGLCASWSGRTIFSPRRGRTCMDPPTPKQRSVKDGASFHTCSSLLQRS